MTVQIHYNLQNHHHTPLRGKIVQLKKEEECAFFVLITEVYGTSYEKEARKGGEVGGGDKKYFEPLNDKNVDRGLPRMKYLFGEYRVS